MTKNITENYYVKNILILILSLSLILFTQWIKVMKYGERGPKITGYTIAGLFILGLFAVIGIAIQRFMQRCPVKFIRDFPILGWVSITSLIFCMMSNEVVKAINGVDFLSITTPILTYAGISVANKLGVLRSLSWKIAITGIFVFIGTYLGSATLAQIGLFLANK
ncbi:hypothetical protein IX317_002008 [Fusobacterium sp. DD29]|uniref:hypothetical protein n=1 Tax=unclassified Fusobacterium TaxID=2648384 RepID=UPI001B8C0DBC|nr:MULTISPECIES: hypothetical protein [unclassified Fusobacterium]MBR8702023.1 hypothetical protein [Fusobacterium sp. DD45]MBR8711832.1 hypothetical protein [Fusobacterium sp. DD28]MBR8750289.1 hypothetical protein [Fusobacterium sp. DD29]MBR8752394.1 hypothetical protein [Fusobacterium sp. DD26]MBR8762530.1 hypothetical protein [Fusobacterium sp. DD25]